MIRFILFLLIAVLGSAIAQQLKNTVSLSAKGNEEQQVEFVPSHYDIQFKVLFEDDVNGTGNKDTAIGKVRIIGSIKADTSQILLDAGYINIDCSSLKV